MIALHLATFPVDRDAVVAIFREYVRSPQADLGFQDYETEFAALPGKYAPPDGCVLLAWRAGEVVGCAALRRVDAQTCELKRVYVRPAARGLRAGRQLVERMLREARQAGYTRMCLDVLPEFQAARVLYASLGFVDAAPVSHNPVPGTRFLALELRD
jgi:GNAT superfamily N-acetyltransferase